MSKKYVLITKRLIIRQFTKDDYADLFEYLSDKQTYKYEPGKPITIEKSKKLCIERAKTRIFFAVKLKSENKIIGHIYFNKIEPKNLLTYEIGYIFNKRYQGKGFATEAIQNFIKYQFSKMNIHKIIAHCNPKNLKSWKLLERLKFKREGKLRKNIFFKKDKNNNPIWIDTFEYGLLKKIYKVMNNSLQKKHLNKFELLQNENYEIKCVTSVFTIFFEDPFWVGILEENYDDL